MPDRDNEELKRILRDYSIVGYPVTVPIFKKGVVEDQPFGGSQAQVRVRSREPIPFDAFTDKMNLSDEKLSEEEHRKKRIYGSHGSAGLSFPIDIMERLWAGEKVSDKDVMFSVLLNMGCIDTDQNVFCYVFPWDDTVVDGLRRGQLVEYEISGLPNTIAGRIVGKRGEDVILLEVFEPMTFMRTPDAIVGEKIERGFYSSHTWALGEGLYKALSKLNPELVPPGQIAGDEYILREPMDITVIEDFCNRNFPRTKGQNYRCLAQAMVLYILPLSVRKGVFRPLRQDAAHDHMEIIAEY